MVQVVGGFESDEVPHGLAPPCRMHSIACIPRSRRQGTEESEVRDTESLEAADGCAPGDDLIAQAFGPDGLVPPCKSHTGRRDGVADAPGQGQFSVGQVRESAMYLFKALKSVHRMPPEYAEWLSAALV